LSGGKSTLQVIDDTQQRNAGDGKKLLKLSKKISAITKFSRVEDYEMAFENWTRKKG
jgi:hypothetical protein